MSRDGDNDMQDACRGVSQDGDDGIDGTIRLSVPIENRLFKMLDGMDSEWKPSAHANPCLIGRFQPVIRSQVLYVGMLDFLL